jgi:hypothetical protein
LRTPEAMQWVGQHSVSCSLDLGQVLDALRASECNGTARLFRVLVEHGYRFPLDSVPGQIKRARGDDRLINTLLTCQSEPRQWGNFVSEAIGNQETKLLKLAFQLGCPRVWLDCDGFAWFHERYCDPVLCAQHRQIQGTTPRRQSSSKRTKL